MAGDYTIAAQSQTQELGASGTLIHVTRAAAPSTPEEYEVTVRVPIAPGWPDNARAKSEARLPEMRSLGA